MGGFKRNFFYFLLHASALAFILLSSNASFAQKANRLQDSLEKKLNWYKQTHPATTLFAHFDKTIYTNNENVWFTAYLLKNVQAIENYHTLSISLINDIDRSILIQEKFVMQNGIASGNLFLPDSIPPGNYTFMLCTNQLVNKQPESVFMQPITVKNTNETGLKATLTIEDSIHYNNIKLQKAILTVTKNNLFPAANAIINYQIMGEDGVALSGQAKTDKAGLYTFELPPYKNSVKVQIKYNKDSKYVHLLLPQPKVQIRVKFYPEGGSLINNLTSNVGWEVKTSEGLPMMVRAVLLQNNLSIDTITTDSYGLGKFVLISHPDVKYSVKLLNQPDSVYDLPLARLAGLVLTVTKSIANDTLTMEMQSSYDTDVFLTVHNYQHLYFSQKMRLKKMQPLKVYVDLTELPKGLEEITLTDSLGHPYAERLFFAHYNQQELINLQTEKQLYYTREKVHLKLSLRRADTSLVKGVVSVACVQDNRLDLKKQNDIESYFYLKNDLGELPIKVNYMGKNSIDKAYLENILLVKGWRNYLWPDLLKAKMQDTIGIVSSAAFIGRITNGRKPIKKPATVFVRTDSTSNIITTTANGNFKIIPNYLITEQDKKVNFLIANNSGLYQINLKDPYMLIYTPLAKQFNTHNFETHSYSQNTEILNMRGLERAIQLNGVTIRANKDNSIYKLHGSNSNACGDFVCVANILNCPNHRFDPSNQWPVQGGRYVINGQLSTYQGCSIKIEKGNYTMSGIYNAKQFYGSDYSAINDSSPDYISTIYWKNFLILDSSKETELNFYTSDITGKFRIVVQGVMSNDVVYNEIFFAVKK